jgi:hypothetical protein
MNLENMFKPLASFFAKRAAGTACEACALQKRSFDFSILIPAIVAGWLGFLKFDASTLLDLDEYYHMAITRIILSGHFPHSLPFKFSMLGSLFADKDLLLHIITVPFLAICADPVIAAKCTTVFMDAVLVLTLCAIMGRYAGKTAAAVLALGLISSPLFTIYSLYLRPATLAILFTVSGLHFMVQKKKWPLFIVSALFALSHVSAFTLLFFACLCEGLRWLYTREFNVDTVAYTLLGLVAGCIVHPNFPVNIATIYVNAILSPMYARSGEIHSFGSELFSGSTSFILSANLLAFGFFFFAFWLAAAIRPRISLQTVFFTLSAQIYMVMAMGATRFWHQALPMILFAASAFWGDISELQLSPAQGRIKKTVIWLWLAMTLIMVAITAHDIGPTLRNRIKFVDPVADAAQWLHGKLPPGTVVYHALWSDAHPLLLLAPEYTYMTALDPVYMMYVRPKTAVVYDKLGEGSISNPHDAIINLFQSHYAFILKATGLYKEIKDMPGFEVMYENPGVVIFQLTDLPDRKLAHSGSKK